MRLILLIGITTLYLAFPPPARSALAERYESPPPKSNIINKREEDEGFHWSYEGNTGPEHWAKHYPSCGGRRQSPIELFDRKPIKAWNPFQFYYYDITPTSVKITHYGHSGGRRQSPIELFDRKLIKAWNPFQFYYYDITPTSVKVTNNGHSVMVTMDMPNRPYVLGGNLDGAYEFVQLHFHWGSNNAVGSEHTIQHNSYPCEVHLVHYKKSYNDTATAILYEDGLAVLGVMFTISEQDNPALAGLITGLASVTQPGQEVTIQPFPLSTFLPKNKNMFYRYQGSLTTPPCNEVVVWTVFKHKLNISTAQLAAFRNLKDANGHPMVDNYRPPQPLSCRRVHFAKLN